MGYCNSLRHLTFWFKRGVCNNIVATGLFIGVFISALFLCFRETELVDLSPHNGRRPLNQWRPSSCALVSGAAGVCVCACCGTVAVGGNSTSSNQLSWMTTADLSEQNRLGKHQNSFFWGKIRKIIFAFIWGPFSNTPNCHVTAVMLVLYPMIFHCILLHPSDAQSFRCSTPNFSKKHYCFTLFYYRFLLYTQHLLWFLRLALPIPSGPPASGLDFPLIAPRSLRTRRSVSMEQCDPQRRATAAATAANPDLSGTKTKTKGSFFGWTMMIHE